MWKDLRLIIFLFLFCLVLAVYDKFSGAFWVDPNKETQVLGAFTIKSPLEMFPVRK